METSKHTNYALPIAVMFMLYFMLAFVTNFAGSMGVIVKHQYAVPNALAQLGNLANFIAYACMGIPAGLILKRKGYKFTSLVAVSVGLVGVAIQWMSGYMESFAVYVIGAFVAGFSMCMLNIVVNPMLNTLGGGGKRGNQLNQLGGAFNSIGGTLAPIILGYLIGGEVAEAKVVDAAPAMMLAMLIFIIAFVVISFTKIPEFHMESAEERAARIAGKSNKDPYSPMSFRHFVLGALAIFCYVGVEVGIPTTANMYMTTHTADALAEMGSDAQPGLGMGAGIAGVLVGIYWFLMMCGRLVGGVIGGMVSSKAMLSTVASVAICLVIGVMIVPENNVVDVNMPAIGLVGEVPVSMICMLLCGLCTSVMWGSIFNLSTEGLGKYTPMASGIFMIMVCGGGVIPFLQNLVADFFGFRLSYMVVIVGLVYILSYALVGSKNVNKNIVKLI